MSAVRACTLISLCISFHPLVRRCDTDNLIGDRDWADLAAREAARCARAVDIG